MKPFRSELRFASLLAYCPRGEGEHHEKSRQLMRAVKGNRIIRSSRESAAAFVSRRIRELEPEELVPEFLGGDVGALVPIPRSSLLRPGALWPALEIADALESEGFGRVANCLARQSAVINVVTRGAQLLGAAWRIWADRPDVEIRGFAVIRTISAPERFEAILAPCIGRIEWKHDDCFREP